MEKVLGQTTGRETYRKRVSASKRAEFLISQHIRPCHGPVQPMDNPDAALKRRNQTNLPLGKKVSFFGAAPILEECSGMVFECGADAAPAMESSLTCFCSLFFISLRRTLEHGLKGRFYLPV